MSACMQLRRTLTTLKRRTMFAAFFIAIQSAREKRPAKYPQGEAEEYFKSAQKMAADSSIPADLP